MRESHLLQSTSSEPSDPQGSRDSCLRGSCPPARRAMGTAPPAGLQPLPSPGAQLEHSWIHPAPGVSLKPIQLLFPPTTFPAGTPSPQGKEVPRRNTPSEISPRRNAQCRAEQPRTGTATPDLLPAGNVVRAWSEVNPSRA